MCETAKQNCHIINHTQHEQKQQTLVTHESFCGHHPIADAIEVSHAIEPSVIKHFSKSALQSNEYNKIPVARDSCVLKATNFNGFLRVNKWCVDAPAVKSNSDKSNRCGPEFVHGGSILMIKRQGREL